MHTKQESEKGIRFEGGGRRNLRNLIAMNDVAGRLTTDFKRWPRSSSLKSWGEERKREGNRKFFGGPGARQNNHGIRAKHEMKKMNESH